jgi:hypothetical protein
LAAGAPVATRRVPFDTGGRWTGLFKNLRNILPHHRDQDEITWPAESWRWQRIGGRPLVIKISMLTTTCAGTWRGRRRLQDDEEWGQQLDLGAAAA